MLTRDEAHHRSLTVATAEYRIALDFTGEGDTFRSTTTIEFDAASYTTWLDLVGDVRRVTLNGTEVTPPEPGSDRIGLSGLQPANTVTVEADCHYRTTGSGIHRFRDPESGETFLYSQFAADDARAAFACFDQPDIKGTFEFTVTAPAHWEVLSNTRAQEPEAHEGARTWHFTPTVLLPCYAAAVVAGPYVYEETTLRSAKGDIPARVYGRPQVREHLAAQRLFDDTQAGIDLYERIFATEYPYDSYDQVYVPEYNFGAMENAGCVTISEDRLLFRTRVSASELEFRSVVVLHELAHMWFGDLVTMKWWDDLWLNESFAEFVATHAAREVTEWADAWVTFGAQRKSVAYAQDQLPTTHPVLSDIPTVDAVAGTFDMITYAKGASALRQLAATLGPETFFAGVAAYVATHHHGNATLADLIAHLQVESGRDLSEWSRAWLETAGVTTLRADAVAGDDGKLTSLRITEDVPDSTVPHPHRLRVAGLTYADGEFARAWEIPVDVEGGSADVPEVAGLPAPDLLLLNDDDLTYAKVRLDARSLVTIEAHLTDLTEPMAQYLVLDALWHMCRDGELPAAQLVDAILAALPRVANSQTLASQCAHLQAAITLYAPVDQTVALTESTADALWDLLRAAPAGSDSQLHLLRAFAALAATPAHAEHVRALLSGQSTLDGLPIDQELTWDLVTALARMGSVTDEDIDGYLATDPGAAGTRRAAGARAALADLDAKRRAWNRLAHPEPGKELPNAVAYETARGLGLATDPGLTAPLVDNFLADVRPMFESMDAFMAMRVAEYAFPVQLAGRVPDFATRLETWLADNQEAPSVLVKIMTEGLDKIRRAERAQAVS